MIKYTFLLHYKQQKELLESLGSTAIVDISVNDWAADTKDKEVMAELSRVKVVIEKLNTFASNNNKIEVPIKPCSIEKCDAATILDKYELAAARIEQLSPLIQKLNREINELQIWGDFDHKLVEKLEQNSLYIHYYSATTSNFEKIDKSSLNLVICSSDRAVNFVTITNSPTQENIEGAQIEKRLNSSLSEKTSELELIESEINNNKSIIVSLSERVQEIENYQNLLKEELSERKVLQTSKSVAEGRLIIVEGFVPENRANEVDTLFENNNSVVIMKNAPTPKDNPPILLKNNRFAKLSEVITRLYSLPSYNELDLTPFFAPFFVFFAGICLGDLGYGILIFALSLFAYFKVKEGKEIAALVMWCAFATMIMGCVTGTFFGISLANTETFGHLPFLGSMDMFTFSLVVGIIQILYGMFIRAIFATKSFGWRYGVPHFAWAFVIMVSAVAYITEQMGLGFSMSSPIYTSLVVALLAVYILFSDPTQKNPLKNLGGGLWNFYNATTGLLGDTLSYIRLFALGLSSGIIAGVFNDLAVGMSGDIPVVKYIIMAIILLLGHGINLFTSAISSFVHPLRLTFVEFYKSAGFEGGGREYSPFKKSQK